MNDQHAGQPGHFYFDPETGTRLTADEWKAKQAKPKRTKKTAEQVVIELESQAEEIELNS